MLAFINLTHPAEAAPGCVDALLAAEASQGIPQGMLVAAALARRYGVAEPDSGLSPWTVTTRKGDQIRIRLHDDMWGALEDVKAKRAARTPEIRLGCAMLLWSAHKAYLRGPEAFFDADQNAVYFARYVARLKLRHGNWTKAIGRAWSEHGWKQRIHACETAHQFVRLRDLPAPKCDLK